MGVGHSDNILVGCAMAHKKGGGGLRSGHIPKKGVLGAGTNPKRGS